MSFVGCILLSECLKIIKYFKNHTFVSLLSNAAESFLIRGGELQPFVKTRWTSIYESTNSILRMRYALDEVFYIYYVSNYNK